LEHLKIRLCSQSNGNEFQKSAEIIPGKFLEIDDGQGTGRSDLGDKEKISKKLQMKD